LLTYAKKASTSVTALEPHGAALFRGSQCRNAKLLQLRLRMFITYGRDFSREQYMK
jgi:hypothetical protein